MSKQESQVKSWNVIDAILDAESSTDVETTIARLGESIEWVPFGNNPGNFGIISMGCDPYDGITERSTNAMDAMIELKVELDPRLKRMKNPRQVVEEVYKIRDGNLKNASDEEIGRMSKDIGVRFLGRKESRMPTIEIQDKGIGQHPRDFPNTLLGLNKDYKISKFYLIGSFGQGGQTSFANCTYGIVISRKCPELLDTGMADVIGWSIVRYRDPSTRDMLYKRGLWEYCVDAKTHQILQAKPKELHSPFAHGTIIRLIEYKMPKGTSDALQPAGGAWGFLSQSLFDPVLPIRLYEDREKYQRKNRPLPGLAPRLWGGGKGDKIDISLNNSYTVDLGIHGKLKINYWALKPTTEPGTQTRWRDAKKGLVTGNSAIFVTLNGQRHATEQTSFLREQINLTYSYDYLIVQVDCDELTNYAKKDLLSSTRDRLREGDMKDLLMSELTTYLKNDRNIIAFERERKNDILSTKTEKDTSKIRALVARYISKNPELSQLIQRTGAEKEESIVPERKPREETEEEIEEAELVIPDLKEIPTFLRIANRKDPIPVRKGGNCLIRLETDAKDAYLDGENVTRFRTIHEGGVTKERSVSLLRNGKISYYVGCPTSIRVGSRGSIAVELDLPNGSSLRVKREIVCVEPIERKTKKGETKLPEPKIIPIGKDNPLWDKLGYDAKSVGQIYLDDNPAIIVSIENMHLLNAKSSKALEDNMAKSVEDRYIAAISYYLLLREVHIRKKKTSDQDTDKESELDRLAQTVCLLAVPLEL